MSKTLKTVGLVLRPAALIATGVGAIGVLGAGIAGVGSFAAIGTALTVASSVASLGSQLTAKPPPIAGSVSQLIIDPNAPQPYIMGEGFFAGVLRHRTGYGGTVDEVENPYLFDVVVYGGGGPYQSITPQVGFEAVPAWYSGFLATDTQLGACPEASALTGSYGTPSGWGASYMLSGQAAIAWNYKFDKKGKKFASGLPQTGALIEGAKAYDPRLDSTFPGGSGSHVLGDESTYEYTANPALHAGTYAYGRYQNGKRVLGIGLPADGIDWQVVADWANVCDTNSWTIFGVAFEPGDKGQNLIDICAAGGGEPVPGGTLSFRYHAAVVALDTVTEADIADEDMRVVAMQSYRDRINIVLPKYRSADHNWEMVQADPISDPDFVTEDGEERPIEWPFNFVKNVDQAAQLAAYKLFDARELHPIEITCLPRLRSYRPGDCLHLDLPQLGLDTDAVILHREIDPATMKVKLTLIGETAAKHAFALGLTGDAPPTPAIGQDSEDRDETTTSATTTPIVDVADATALAALGGPAERLAKRLDTGETYSHNGGTTATIADWTLIGTTVLTDDLEAIEALTGTGIAARVASNDWELRMLTAPAAGLTITDPAGVAGNPTFVLANDLAALEGLGSTGFAARTAADTWAQRTITGTASEITVTNGDGVAGNPTLSLPSALTFTGKTVTGGAFTGLSSVSASGNVTTTAGDFFLANAHYLWGKTAAAANTRLIGMNGSDVVFVGSVDQAASSINFNSGGTAWAVLNSSAMNLGAAVAYQIGNNTVITSSRHPQLRSYTVGTLPSAATAAQWIYVSDETGGPTPAFSDATNWRRVSDLAIVA